MHVCVHVRMYACTYVCMSPPTCAAPPPNASWPRAHMYIRMCACACVHAVTSRVRRSASECIMATRSHIAPIAMSDSCSCRRAVDSLCWAELSCSRRTALPAHCMNVCMRVRVHACMYVHTYVYVRVYAHVCMYMCMCMYASYSTSPSLLEPSLHTHTHTHARMCTCTHVYMHACIHACTHTRLLLLALLEPSRRAPPPLKPHTLRC